MPGAKRITRSVSYAEHDDDDDFVSKVNTKKNRNTKLNERNVEIKSTTTTTTRQHARKRNERLSKIEQAELDLALQLSKEETVATSEISIDLSSLSNDKQIANISNNKTKKSLEKNTSEIHDSKENDEEILLPKSKRMKLEDEEEEIIIEGVKKDDESSSDEEIDEEEEEGEEENEKEEEQQQQTPPRKKTNRKSDESQKPIVEDNSSRLVTRNQRKSSSTNSISTTEHTMKKGNAPLGFPTSKINIPSLQPSRVGLSRKSGAIKPLHPNLNQRVVHE